MCRHWRGVQFAGSTTRRESTVFAVHSVCVVQTESRAATPHVHIPTVSTHTYVASYTRFTIWKAEPRVIMMTFCKLESFILVLSSCEHVEKWIPQWCGHLQMTRRSFHSWKFPPVMQIPLVIRHFSTSEGRCIVRIPPYCIRILGCILRSAKWIRNLRMATTSCLAQFRGMLASVELLECKKCSSIFFPVDTIFAFVLFLSVPAPFSLSSMT